jgi:hypothetical protein
LERKGWIKRNQSPQDSRFWRLIEGNTAAMFGVFSGYEKQLLHDWIVGDWQDSQRPKPIPRDHTVSDTGDAFEAQDPELIALRKYLSDQSPHQQLQALIPWLSAQRHWHPAGLYATRHFIELVARLR